jgi:hypothetical protein
VQQDHFASRSRQVFESLLDSHGGFAVVRVLSSRDRRHVNGAVTSPRARHAAGRSSANRAQPFWKATPILEQRELTAYRRERLLSRIFREMAVGQPTAGDGDSHAVVALIEFAKTPEVSATSGLDQFRIGVFQRSASVFAVCVPPAVQPVSVPSADKCARTDDDFDEIRGINDPRIAWGRIPVEPWSIQGSRIKNASRPLWSQPTGSMSEEPSRLSRPTNWPARWYPVDAPMAAALEAELKRELHKEHALYGLQASVLAGRFDRDDALFRVRGKQSLLAEVHLTWRGSTEPTAKWPSSRLSDQFEDWAAAQWPEPE